jgi:hypothetical protein
METQQELLENCFLRWKNLPLGVNVIKHFSFVIYEFLFWGPGKSTYTFSTERLLLSAPCQASVGRATWRGSGKQKSADVRQKTYTLIYPDPTVC